MYALLADTYLTANVGSITFSKSALFDVISTAGLSIVTSEEVQVQLQLQHTSLKMLKLRMLL